MSPSFPYRTLVRSGLPLLDDLGRRDAFEARGDFFQRLVVPIVDRDVLAFAGLGDLFQQIETRPAVVGFTVKKRRGETGFVATEHLRSEEHTSELQSLMRISYAVVCLKKKQHE